MSLSKTYKNILILRKKNGLIAYPRGNDGTNELWNKGRNVIQITFTARRTYTCCDDTAKMDRLLHYRSGCAINAVLTAITPMDEMNANKDILEHGKFEPNAGAVPIKWVSI